MGHAIHALYVIEKNSVYGRAMEKESVVLIECCIYLSSINVLHYVNIKLFNESRKRSFVIGINEIVEKKYYFLFGQK